MTASFLWSQLRIWFWRQEDSRVYQVTSCNKTQVTVLASCSTSEHIPPQMPIFSFKCSGGTSHIINKLQLILSNHNYGSFEQSKAIFFETYEILGNFTHLFSGKYVNKLHQSCIFSNMNSHETWCWVQFLEISFIFFQSLNMRIYARYCN